ncbi:hypothetical protein [Phyllobacterium myrsinacearum]|uniref:hypothetical protein n=1 Tax=Phyllobacterium myrsinacearum TaxID=28101 RepID=UPI0010299961|nr:hypothetical protein [Phyllobacterium myrsinacearum]
MGDIADVISTSSLLLAVLTGLLGFWHPLVVAALDEDEPRLPAERRRARERVLGIFLYKALPLAIASAAIAAVFLPRAIKMVTLSVGLIGKNWRYNDLSAAFILTQVLMMVLAGATTSLAIQLYAKFNKLK